MKVLPLLALLALVPSPSAMTPIPCAPHVTNGVIPQWARTGFSDPQPRMAHVLGRRGEIVALIFGYPLLSPPGANRNNKILWVARRYVGYVPALRISAQRMVGARTVGAPVRRAVAGGPGPSIVDMPQAGCWRFSLHWGKRSDSLDLVYR